MSKLFESALFILNIFLLHATDYCVQDGILLLYRLYNHISRFYITTYITSGLYKSILYQVLIK